MYKVLITDDEQIVVDSLFFILKNNFEGQVKLFSANSGPEALNIATKEEIDIIFMDINMPGMNGLETIKCILNLKPKTVIIILSAFDNFEYAQEALNIGAYKYITKPVNKNLVVQMVRSAMNAVDTRNTAGTDESELAKQLEKISPVLENDFFYSCVFRRSDAENIYTFMDYFKIKEEKFAIACIELPDSEEKILEEKYERLKEEFRSKEKCLVSALFVNRIIVFFWFENESSPENLKKRLNNLYNIVSLRLGRGVRQGVSEIFNDVSKTAEAYRIALEALNAADDRGGINFNEHKENGSVTLQNINANPDFSEKNGIAVSESKEVDQILTSFYNRLKIGDVTGVHFIFENFLDTMEKDGADFETLSAEVFEILVNAKNIVREDLVQCQFPSAKETFSAILKACETSDKKALSSYALRILLQVAEQVKENRRGKKNPTIMKVLSYLEEHLSDSISLEMAANYAGINPFYLSKLFREEMGDTFVNYISEKRMEKAKKLLSDSSLSIKEITAEIGYNDQNYFSKSFKAKFGISPTDFRRSGE